MYLFINLNQQPQTEFIMNRFRPKMPSFGIAYIASILKTIGVRSVLYDDNLLEYNDSQFRELFRKYEV